MRIQVQMVIIADDGTQQEQLITTLQRESPRAETLGLTLSESKEILQQTQQVLIGHQIAAYLTQQRPCPACATPRRIKQQATAPFRTLFGRVDVENPRWYHCRCQRLLNMYSSFVRIKNPKTVKKYRP